MDRSTKPPSGGAPRQPWNPEQAPRGVSCPACGLTNEPGARVCRNCGLPIAGASDPLRGVMPGRVDLPTSRRSGLGATLGLALVIGLLVVGGVLAVNGGGILSGGGRLGVGADATRAPDAAASQDPAAVGDSTPAPDDQVPVDEPTGDGNDSPRTSFGYTCEDAAITDLGEGRWFLSQFRAGVRDEDGETYERITWEMQKRGSAKNGTTATMEWMTPKEAKDLGSTLLSGNRVIVVTFDGPVDITVGQQLDQLLLEPEGITDIRTIDMFQGEDGNVRTVIGIRGESCARMSSLGWTKKGTAKNARVYLDVERP